MQKYQELNKMKILNSKWPIVKVLLIIIKNKIGTSPGQTYINCVVGSEMHKLTSQNKKLIFSSFSPRRDLNNFIIRFFLSIYSYPFFGDYIIRQCYKIVINELFEGKRKTTVNTQIKDKLKLKLTLLIKNSLSTK
jgi:hypothetical protein